MTKETIAEKYAEWINRDIGATETFDRERLRGFDAMLDREHDPTSRHIPALSHWLCFLPDVKQSKLGPDGHAERGGFLPPIPLPRRMWAGCRIEFIQPIEYGAQVTRRTRVKDIKEKNGSSGHLVFVTTEHEFLVDGAVHIREEQDLVFREAASESVPLLPGELREAAHRLPVEPTTVLLFRYSALTFNAHKIHYDREYARKEEHYPGLVVHGPLQATLLANYAQERMLERKLKSLTFRAQRPIFDIALFTLNAAEPEGDTLDLWTADGEDFVAMSAKATFA